MLPPANETMHVPSPNICKPLESLGRTIFRGNRIDEICPENRCQQLCFSVRPFLPTELSLSYFPRFPVCPPCRRSVVTPVSLLPTATLPKLFTPVHRSFPPELSPSFFPRFPFRPPCRHSRIAPSHRSSPQAISQSFPMSTFSSLPHRSFPPELAPSYFPRFPHRPPSRRFRIAPSPRSSPQAISHGFSSVHPIVASVSLLPHGALPKLFPTVSLPSTLLSLPYRSFPMELPPSYFLRFPFPPCYFYFPRFPFRPPCRHSRIAPSHRSSPQAISNGFPFVHPVVAPASLLPTGALPICYFLRFPLPPPNHCFHPFPPNELPPSYFPRFPPVHPLVKSVSLPRGKCG